MAAVNQNFEMYAGNTFRLEFLLRQPDGTPLDLTGVIAVRWWLGKNNKAKGTDVYVKKSNLTGAGEGGITLTQGIDNYWTATVRLESDDTEDLAPNPNLYHELEVIDVAEEVSTVAVGKCKLDPVIIDPDLDVSP